MTKAELELKLEKTETENGRMALALRASMQNRLVYHGLYATDQASRGTRVKVYQVIGTDILLEAAISLSDANEYYAGLMSEGQKAICFKALAGNPNPNVVDFETKFNRAMKDREYLGTTPF